MALDNIDASRPNIYDIDLFTGIRMMMDVWDKLPEDLIQECWKE